MSPRRGRVKRIIEVREKQLDEKVKALRASEAAAEEAARAKADAEVRLAEAAEERNRLASGTSDLQSWIEANEWLQARAALVELARRKVDSASQAVEVARTHVSSAHADVRRMEALSTRIEKQEKITEDRRERRQDDEIAAQRFERALERWKSSDR